MELRNNLIALLRSESKVARETALEINKGVHLVDDMLTAYKAFEVYLFQKDVKKHIIEKGVQNLDLRYNQLATLPAEIGQLTALQNLDLRGNQLTTLPAEIGQLTALQNLDLMGNQLTTLPAEIGQLTALQNLDLMGNRLTIKEKKRIKNALPNCEILF